MGSTTGRYISGLSPSFPDKCLQVPAICMTFLQRKHQKEGLPYSSKILSYAPLCDAAIALNADTENGEPVASSNPMPVAM